MAVDVRILAAVLVVYAAPVFTDEQRCSYMIEVPRLPKPEDLPQENFDGLSWNERPLIPAPEREDLCMDAYFPRGASEGLQIIYVDEERTEDIAVAKLNYNGDGTPTVDRSFDSGAFADLGPDIRRGSDGGWYLYTTVRQDYEAGMTGYMFNVRVPDETLVVSVSLRIVNIDDNRPIIQILEPCRVPELGEARLTECEYQVSDADGRISTIAMWFTVDSERDDAEIFYMEGTPNPANWFVMTMTVGIRKPLNFEENPLHIFSVTAFDSLPNNQTATLMVQVANVEHRPPRWVEIFAVQRFDEKTEQNFTVRAIDGDTEINKPIYYKLETDPEDTFFRIETIPGGRNGAIFYVDEINRDLLMREVFQLSIIAYKYDNESFATTASVAIIVNDINDNPPLPLHPEYRIEIDEETPMTLELEEFGFHDIDLGPHAQYEVHLEAVYPPNAEQGFYIAPTVGYQLQTFTMGTTNHSMLDYEDIPFQNIILRVVATDLNRTEFTGVAMLYIDLKNWNDEEPIFEVDTKTVSFNETEGEGFFVATMLAEDLDIGDVVLHSLMGNVADFLHIDEISGDIYVSANNSFDYHRQNRIFVQVRADDTLGAPNRTATSQLVIELLDINNTPPTLRLPRVSLQVDENEPDGFEITNENSVITATDPDTTAHLVFEIDWEDSYATKHGRDTDPNEFHDCVSINTTYPVEGDYGSAEGHLVVREIREGVTIDFEMFEVLYLTIRVRDLNTVLGSPTDEGFLTVTIIDRNDNPPIFEEGTLEQEFMVREMSSSGVVIGSVLATDIDGPLYNQVRYTISAREDTPDDLVTINFYTGQITVLRNQAIDADSPPRYNLYYTIIATDCCYAEDEADCPPDTHCHNTPGDIVVSITDTNNKVPQPDYERFNTTVYIYENATSGDEVTYVRAIDDDRDEIYHTVRFQINYNVAPRLMDFFKVDLDSGLVYVDYTNPTVVLDRDGDEPQHRIFFNLIDNFFMDGDGNRNQDVTEILVVLLDVNDNAPELPDPSEHYWPVSESVLADVSIPPVLHAPDRDEPNTPNSLVGFEVLNITAVNRDIQTPELFTIQSIDTDKGELVSLMDLRGFWGTYALHVHAFDHGEPQQHSYEIYDVIIRPYNYHAPVIVFPENGAVIRLARERAMQINSMLETVDGQLLRRIEATDEDGLEAGQVSFSVSADDEAAAYFDVDNDPADDQNFGTLRLQQTFSDAREFQITIRGTDGGTDPGPLWSEITFRAVFIPTTGEPEFGISTATVAFIEKEAGLLERHELPLAEDPKNYLCTNDCHDIYYRILEGNNNGQFGLDATTNVIYLVSELDRNISAQHTLLIATSNSPDGGIPLSASLLTVTVTVREADPRPMFQSEMYTAAISTSNNINDELLTVMAVHTEGSPLTYGIVEGSMVVDSSLEAVKDSAFSLDTQTGVLTLTIRPTNSMQGMFDFKVVATDEAGGSDTTDVRIYLISAANRVTFIFLNTLEKVENNVQFIEDTFSNGFRMTCNIDSVVPDSDSAGLALENSTAVLAHFLNENEPVLAEEIEQIRSDTILLGQIQTILWAENLSLADVFTDSSPDLSTDGNQITIYVLAALAGILAFMCLVLLLTFIIKTRALNRRLEALSMTKYGSVDSGLNRTAIAAPGTNKHAVEGSNPVWNEVLKAPDFDAISDTTDDSDLIGIEDLPQFRNDYFPPGDTDSVQEMFDNDPRHNPVSSHNNSFGFNPTPFSPEFANNQFRRK